MKKENVPQHLSSLGKITKEVCYATDSTGRYTQELSSGWDVKIGALDAAWNDIAERIANARREVLAGKASPLLFFMEYRLMDVSLLADYTGFWQWQIKRHLHPANFKALSSEKLQKYAQAFAVNLQQLQNMDVQDA